jgi:ClpP class serine protease
LGQAFLEGLEDRVKTFTIDPEKYGMFIERTTRNAEDGEDLFVKIGSTAHIPIMGPITTAPDFFMDMMGGGNAVYGDIVAAVNAAEADESIERVVFEIDSPGGETSGFLRTAQAIAAMTKPTEAQVTNIAASAAYGLAVQADRVVAENAMTMLGSVGVVTTRFVSDGKVTITSTDAPDKAPDANTVEGIDAIRRELDSIHVEFVKIIASGRGGSSATVNADFGRGALIIAGDALQAGMIDVIGSGTSKSAANDGSSSRNDASAGDSMDRTEMQAKHPALLAELEASANAAGVLSGTKSERSRVAAHIKTGAAMGAGVVACKHIMDGTAFGDPEVQADYLIAGRNAADAGNRVEDDDGISDLSSGPGKTGTGDDKPDEKTRIATLFSGVRENLGIGGGAE